MSTDKCFEAATKVLEVASECSSTLGKVEYQRLRVDEALARLKDWTGTASPAEIGDIAQAALDKANQTFEIVNNIDHSQFLTQGALNNALAQYPTTSWVNTQLGQYAKAGDLAVLSSQMTTMQGDVNTAKTKAEQALSLASALQGMDSETLQEIATTVQEIKDIDFSNLASKSDLANFATKSDLSGLATSAQITTLTTAVQKAQADATEALENVALITPGSDLGTVLRDLTYKNIGILRGQTQFKEGGVPGIIVGSNFYSFSGRKLYRHSSNMGTVIEYETDSLHKLLVLDAQYRFCMPMYDSATVPEARWPDTLVKLDVPYGAVFTGIPSVYGVDDTPCATDAQLKTAQPAAGGSATYVGNIANYRDSQTAAQKTSILAAQNYAWATQCQAIKVGTESCAVPTLTQLMRIYLEMDSLDWLDPTAAGNRAKALGCKRSNGKWSAIDTSSTIVSSTPVTGSDSDGYYLSGITDRAALFRMDFNNANPANYRVGIIPVLELA